MSMTQFPCQKTAQLVARELEDGLLILDQNNEKIHQLNTAAAEVWKRCDGDLTSAQIASQLSELYEVELSVVTQDVARILADLESLHLIEWRS